MKRLFAFLICAILLFTTGCTVHVPDEKLPEASKTQEELKLEYLRGLIESYEGHSGLDLSNADTNVNVEYVKWIPAKYGSLPKDIQTQEAAYNEYHPAVYDETDIFPESEGKYIYVIQYEHFSNPSCLNGVANVIFEGGKLSIALDITPSNSCTPNMISLIKVVKIEKESLGAWNIDEIEFSSVVRTQEDIPDDTAEEYIPVSAGHEYIGHLLEGTSTQFDLTNTGTNINVEFLKYSNLPVSYVPEKFRKNDLNICKDTEVFSNATGKYLYVFAYIKSTENSSSITNIRSIILKDGVLNISIDRFITDEKNPYVHQKKYIILKIEANEKTEAINAVNFEFEDRTPLMNLADLIAGGNGAEIPIIKEGSDINICSAKVFRNIYGIGLPIKNNSSLPTFKKASTLDAVFFNGEDFLPDGYEDRQYAIFKVSSQREINFESLSNISIDDTALHLDLALNLDYDKASFFQDWVIVLEFKKDTLGANINSFVVDPKFDTLSYLRHIITKSPQKDRIDTSNIDSNIKLEYVRMVNTIGTYLPSELFVRENYQYLPVIYDEKELFPETEGKYLYLLYFEDFPTSTLDIDGVSEATLKDGILNVVVEEFTYDYATADMYHILFIAKIEKASLGENNIDKVTWSYNITTAKEFNNSIRESTDKRICDTAGIDTDIEIASIEVIQNVERKHNIPNAPSHKDGFYATQPDEYSRIYRTDPNSEYDYLEIILISGPRKVLFDRITSTETEGMFDKVVTFNIVLKEVPNDTGEEYCEIVRIKYKAETLSAIEGGRLRAVYKYTVE